MAADHRGTKMSQGECEDGKRQAAAGARHRVELRKALSAQRRKARSSIARVRHGSASAGGDRRRRHHESGRGRGCDPQPGRAQPHPAERVRDRCVWLQRHREADHAAVDDGPGVGKQPPVGGPTAHPVRHQRRVHRQGDPDASKRGRNDGRPARGRETRDGQRVHDGGARSGSRSQGGRCRRVLSSEHVRGIVRRGAGGSGDGGAARPGRVGDLDHHRRRWRDGVHRATSRWAATRSPKRSRSN